MEALLVALHYPAGYDYEISINEIRQLAAACDLKITDFIEQEIEPQIATYVGKGKLAEIARRSESVECVIFNEELTPLQMRNITAVIDALVLDRTDLILRIFEKRAKSKEAILQVEMARLNYELPRLAGAHQEIYSQQGGSGFRGAGEQQIELERRHIRRRLSQAKKELETVRRNRATQRKRRKNKDCIALVGYTNSGKSSLLNLFTNKKVKSEDMLFATLQTSARRVLLAQKKEVLMIDTVGFISQLPHTLIDAFKATLEEVTEADLIVFVIDSSSSYTDLQIQVTTQVLEELGVSETPILYAYNKIDLPHDTLVTKEPHVLISVKEKRGIDELENKMCAMLEENYERFHLFIPYQDGEVYARLVQDGVVIKESFNETGIDLLIHAPAYYGKQYARYKV